MGVITNMNLTAVKVYSAGDHRCLGVHDASPKEFHSVASLADHIYLELQLSKVIGLSFEAHFILRTFSPT